MLSALVSPPLLHYLRIVNKSYIPIHYLMILKISVTHPQISPFQTEEIQFLISSYEIVTPSPLLF